MKRGFAAILLFWIAAYFYLTHRLPSQPPRAHTEAESPNPQAPPEPPRARPIPASRPSVLINTPRPSPLIVNSRGTKQGKPALHYRIIHDLMVVQGDQVAGAPTSDKTPPNGLVQMPPVKLWPKGIVPFHIQPDVPDPDRVLQAIAMFDGTAIHFTPYNNEEEVLVFEQGDEDCMSYVGKMGGKQPIWISTGCRPEEIAHEILHALGFVHEQNRSDRDGYVSVHFENIDERYLENFEKLPVEFMKVSGLGEFDYQSIMMYPPWMFAKNGQSTMDPLLKDRLIAPMPRLSPGDIDRLNRAYQK